MKKTIRKRYRQQPDDGSASRRKAAFVTILLSAALAAPAWHPLAAQQEPPRSSFLPPADPKLAAIREMDPQTPVELTRTIDLALGLGYPDEANKLLERLLAAKLDAATLVELHKEFGSGVFLRMSRREEFDPEGREFARAVLAAAHRFTRDPVRLQEQVQRLSDPSATVRRDALATLREADEAAVAPLLAGLADSRQPENHARYRAALTALGRSAVEPLIGATGSSDAPLRIQVLQVLGRLSDVRAVPYLLRPYLSPQSTEPERRAAATALEQLVGSLPTRAEAQRLLEARVRSNLQGRAPAKTGLEGDVVVWAWNHAQKTSLPLRLPAEAAAILTAARLAEDLTRMEPDEPRLAQLALLANLEADKRIGGWDQPLPQGPGTAHQIAVSAGPGAVEDVLATAMRQRNLAAAIGAAEVLGEIGDARLLRGDGGRPTPLVRALGNADRRLRFAAAAAIMRIDPRQGYAGASQLPEVLGYLAGSTGARRALVAHANPQQASALAGLLRELGIEPVTAATPRRALKLAASWADIEFVLLSDAFGPPGVHEVVQMLRRDPRSAKLPVGVLASQSHLAKARRLADLDPLAVAFAQPLGPKGAAYVVQGVLAVRGRHPVEADERLLQASTALDWLGHLAAHSREYGFYDVFRQQDQVERVLDVPALTAKAARVLGLLGSADAQTALVDLASEHARPLAQRQAAAEAFDLAVRRRGLMLNSEQVLAQYDRYNQTEMLDRDTQKLLSMVLDTIESRQASTK